MGVQLARAMRDGCQKAESTLVSVLCNRDKRSEDEQLVAEEHRAGDGRKSVSLVTRHASCSPA
jgi:hypothetical protein